MRLLRRPLLILGAACTLVVSLSGQTVRVLSVSGEATLQAPGDSSPRTVKKGDTIVVGTRIVTGEGARVILTPLPGVNSIIAPKSEVVIERVSVSTPAGAKTALHSAVLDLKTGAVTTDLKPTEGVELDYGVRTARGLAGARGTTYTVGINAAGIQTIVVADGVISLTLADGRTVNLVPGQVSITQTDGSTQSVASASELSTGDQAIADNWVETTLDALAEAIEQGVDIDPDALEDAIRAAHELGIDIDADTQSRLDRARDLLVERRLLAQLDTQNTWGPADPADGTTIVTEFQQSQDGTHTPPPDDAYLQAREAYRASLTESQRSTFDSLPDDAQRPLVLVDEAPFTAYGLDTYGEGQTRPAAAIRYAGALSSTLRSVFLARPEDVQSLLVAYPSDTALRDYALSPNGPESYPDAYVVSYFKLLGSGQRSAFRNLDASRQGSLAEINDPDLTTYALAAGRTPAQFDYAIALPATERGLFLSFPANVQGVLVANPDDTALATFAYEGGGNLHSHAAIIFYSGLGETDRTAFKLRPSELQESAANDAAFATLLLARDSVTNELVHSDASLNHYLDLGAATRPAYLARSVEVREQLAALAKPALTAAVLDPASFESPPSDGDLRRNLGALLALSPENRALFETFAGGPTYSKLESAPGPYDWSDAAWTRTRNSFGALSSTNQNRVIDLGAIEGLFDYSATFIDAALQDYDNTLSTSERSAILSAGWGRLFADYFANEDLRPLLAAAADFGPSELNTIRQFDISPFAFSEFSDETPVFQATSETALSRVSDPKDNLAVLAALPAADRTKLAQLLAGDDILFVSGPGYYDDTENYVYPTYAETLANALAFAGEFSADLATLSETGLGQHLFRYAPDDTVWVGDSQTTARERLAYLVGLYRGLSPDHQELAHDLGLFDNIYFEDLNLEPSTLASTLDTLGALSQTTRDYLATSRDDIPLFELVNGGGEYSYYSLSEIDGLLSSLTADEFATLRELKPGSALLRGTYSDGGLISSADLKAFLGFVASLGDLQRFTLNELGITNQHNERKGLFLSDHEGLARLLQAYAELPAKLRVETRQIRPYDSYRDYVGRSFFFASDDGYDHTTFNVTFTSPDDLHVGATRRLSLYRDGFSNSTTFTVPAGKDVYLRASTLIDLDGVSFSENVRAIVMEAATLNLANLDFPGTSVVSLNSRLGGMGTGNRYPNFDGTSIPGRVNFLYNVSYGGAAMFDEASFDSASRGNIVIGTLQNPAPLPTYTPPSVIQPLVQ